MTPKIQAIIDEIIRAEGGYVNDPKDAGGETNFGITKSTAQANGYTGIMREMPRSFAERVYADEYISKPGFSLLIPSSEAIAAEVIDTGVNMGPAVAAKFLQRSLNALNNQGQHYAEISVDGKVGKATVAALNAYLAKRGKAGEQVMLKALNCLQGARYIDLAEQRGANESFLYGWLANRVSL